MADIVFATAMSIMILNLDIPNISGITDTSDLTEFLLKQLSGMATFFIAFMTVAIYWIKHIEHFSVTAKVNQTYTLFQLVFLALIMLIPFWNTYLSQAPDNVAIKVFLSINMILVGVFSFLSMHYAAQPQSRLLNNEFGAEEVKIAKAQILTEPIIAAIAAGVAFIDPVYWDIAFILIPILFATRKKWTSVKFFTRFKNKD